MESIDAATKSWKVALASALGVAADNPELALAPFGLHALYTSGDGNCLLHAASLATYGVRDTREAEIGEPGACDADERARIAPRRTLRAAVHHSLTQCTALRALLASHGAVLDGGVSGTEARVTGESLEDRSRLHGNSLDPPHMLVLAHILRRPIVCYATAAVGEVRDADGKSFSSYAARGERMSGIYLPSLLPPEMCVADPLTIAYTPGHFSVLVGSEVASNADTWRALGLTPPDPPATPLPLADETLSPLPVLFLPPPPGLLTPPAAAAHERQLLEAYMPVHMGTLQQPAANEGDTVEVRTVPVSAQRVPPRGLANPGVGDHFYEAVWAKRYAAATQPQPAEDTVGIDGEPPKPPPASRSGSFLMRAESEKQLADAIAMSLADTSPGPPRPSAPGPPVVLMDKTEALRVHLGLPIGTPITQTVERACEHFGLVGSLEGRPLKDKADACLQAMPEQV